MPEKRGTNGRRLLSPAIMHEGQASSQTYSAKA